MDIGFSDYPRLLEGCAIIDGVQDVEVFTSSIFDVDYIHTHLVVELVWLWHGDFVCPRFALCLFTGITPVCFCSFDVRFISF